MVLSSGRGLPLAREKSTLFFSLYVKQEVCCGGAGGGADLSGRRDICLREGEAMREVNFIMHGQEHVERPAEGLSSTGT